MPNASFSAVSLYPVIETAASPSPITVTGTVRKPRAISSWYASRSSSTFLVVNAIPACESHAFTRSQGRQLSPTNTTMRGASIFRL